MGSDRVVGLHSRAAGTVRRIAAIHDDGTVVGSGLDYLPGNWVDRICPTLPLR